MSKSSQPPPRFYAEPPAVGVSTDEWARAFLEAQSPNPKVRDRGRAKLTDLGYQWTEDHTI